MTILPETVEEGSTLEKSPPTNHEAPGENRAEVSTKSTHVLMKFGKVSYVSCFPRRGGAEGGGDSSSRSRRKGRSRQGNRQEGRRGRGGRTRSWQKGGRGGGGGGEQSSGRRQNRGSTLSPATVATKVSETFLLLQYTTRFGLRQVIVKARLPDPAAAEALVQDDQVLLEGVRRPAVLLRRGGSVRIDRLEEEPQGAVDGGGAGRVPQGEEGRIRVQVVVFGSSCLFVCLLRGHCQS